LSPQQARLWSLQQQSSAYYASCSLMIEGNLHISSLCQALETIFRRHEIYRTSFCRLSGMKLPVQVVNPSPLSVFLHCDLSACSPLDQNKPLADLMQAKSSASFDLEQGPLVSSTLFTLHDKRNMLFTHFHVLSVDASTLSHFVKEVAHSYQNPVCSTGSDAQQVQYIQFSEWQNSLLAEEGASALHGYLQDKWQKDFLSLTFPCEQNNAEPAIFSPAWFAVSLERSLSTHVEALLEKQQCQWSVFLLACWQILLSRLTGREVLLIGLGVDT